MSEKKKILVVGSQGTQSQIDEAVKDFCEANDIDVTNVEVLTDDDINRERDDLNELIGLGNRDVKERYMIEQTHPIYPPVSKPSQYVRKEKKINNNDPCHCGSGRKYKHCHKNK